MRGACAQSARNASTAALIELTFLHGRRPDVPFGSLVAYDS